MVIRAWHDVGTCRDATGHNLLPYVAVLEWAAFYQLETDVTLMLWDALQYADGERADREASKRRLEKIRGKQ